jgi:hypothetical protein
MLPRAKAFDRPQGRALRYSFNSNKVRVVTLMQRMTMECPRVTAATLNIGSHTLSSCVVMLMMASIRRQRG